MKIQESKPEVQRALRAIHDAFDTVRKDNPGKRYSLVFALGTEPMQNLSESEVASFIEVANRIVGQFAGNSKISIQFDIVEYSDVAEKLVQASRTNYEESIRLEGGKGSKLVGVEKDIDVAKAQAGSQS